VLRHAVARTRQPAGRCGQEEKNIPVLAKYAREGYAIIGAIPSCVLMYKHELPLMFPDDAGRASGQ